jgi:hypothetical protein
MAKGQLGGGADAPFQPPCFSPDSRQNSPCSLPRAKLETSRFDCQIGDEAGVDLFFALISARKQGGNRGAGTVRFGQPRSCPPVAFST